MGTNDSDAPIPISGVVDLRNRLNDLTNKEWMISTKSVWRSMIADNTPDSLTDDELFDFSQWLIAKKGEGAAQIILEQLFPSVLLSTPPARDDLKTKHPATFAETDIAKLIQFFTKRGQTVLDPFLGSGSTLVACRTTNRNGIGIEVVPEWADVAKKRAVVKDLPLFQDIDIGAVCKQQVFCGDSREVLKSFDQEAFDFIVTSPPYWKILHKDTDHKATRERTTKGLNTRYSELDNDLGNLNSYDEFLEQLKIIFAECYRVLKNGKYMCVIVSDFRDKGKFITYHTDITRIVEEISFTLQGITILAQDNKNLYPYGIPYAFVSNINHQFILIFQKKE